MAYRTLKQPGDTAGGVSIKGLKITTKADIAINRMIGMAQSTEAKNSFIKIRDGSAPTNSGTYRLNGHVCFHMKFNNQAHALAWRAPAGDSFTYIEAVLAKTGSGNSYQEV